MQMQMRKVTKAQFNRFCEVFRKYQLLLFGLTEFRVDFWHVPLDEVYAEIYIDEDNKVASVNF